MSAILFPFSVISTFNLNIIIFVNALCCACCRYAKDIVLSSFSRIALPSLKHPQHATIQCDSDKFTLPFNNEPETKPEMTNTSRHFVSVGTVMLVAPLMSDVNSVNAPLTSPTNDDVPIPLWSTLGLIMGSVDVLLLIYRLTNLCFRFRRLTASFTNAETFTDDEEDNKDGGIRLQERNRQCIAVAMNHSLDSQSTVVISCTAHSSPETVTMTVSGSNRAITTTADGNYGNYSRSDENLEDCILPALHQPHHPDDWPSSTLLMLALRSAFVTKLVLFSFLCLSTSVALSMAGRLFFSMVTSLISQATSLPEVWRQDVLLPVVSDLEIVDDRIRNELMTSFQQFSVVALSHFEVMADLFRRGKVLRQMVDQRVTQCSRNKILQFIHEVLPFL